MTCHNHRTPSNWSSNSKMNSKIITIGGTGFIGKAIQQYSKYSKNVIPLSRNTTPSINLAGNLDNLRPYLSNDAVVINLVGLLHQTSGNTFDKVQWEGTKHIVDLLNKHGCKKYIHISAIGANKDSPIPYARTKGLAEDYILKNLNLPATILRPSIVFGPSDSFFNRFSRMSNYMPVFPLVGNGLSKFQPIYVNDLITVFDAVIENSISNGKIYELGGPQVLTYKEIIEMVLQCRHKNRSFIKIPTSLMLIVAYALEFLPPSSDLVLTRDQVRLLQIDNVCSKDFASVSDLGINPKDFKSPETTVSQYIK